MNLSGQKLNSLVRETVPRISPVDSRIQRPRWSVMIPTFNCAELLRETLKSVLEQAPSPDDMQIMVVDDHSTRDDPEAVVREVGKDRVQFFRQPENVGATRNFNACLEFSIGRRVHILHGDDCVLPGFYDAVNQTAEHFPHAALIATRAFTIDLGGEILDLSERAQMLENFSRDIRPFLIRNHFFFPAVTLARSFVETYGGFDSRFIHVADWEMWTRAIRLQGGVFINRPLAAYRIFPENDTSRLRRTAGNLEDYLQLRDVFAAENEDFPMADFMHQLRRFTYYQMATFKKLNDKEAFRANRAFWKKIVSPSVLFKLAMKAAIQRLRSL